MVTSQEPLASQPLPAGQQPEGHCMGAAGGHVVAPAVTPRQTPESEPQVAPVGQHQPSTGSSKCHKATVPEMEVRGAAKSAAICAAPVAVESTRTSSMAP
jgi:hypothetical protein